MIIAAWPGTGKTWAGKNIQGITDLESGDFKWADDMTSVDPEARKSMRTVMRPDWPDNYIDAIWDAHMDGQTVLMAMHPQVRQALRDRGAAIAVVAPHRDAKAEYLNRYVSRGNTRENVAHMSAHWDEYMDMIEDDAVIRLDKWQVLSDILPVRDGRLVGEVMVGDDQRFYAVENGVLWAMEGRTLTAVGRVDDTSAYSRNRPTRRGITITNGRQAIHVRTSYWVRPVRADQVKPGDEVRWTGLNRTIAEAKVLDAESIGIRFNGAGYHVPLHVSHQLDVILTEEPARPVWAISTPEEAERLPHGAVILDDHQSVYQRDEEDVDALASWGTTDGSGAFSQDLSYPVTVLWTPSSPTEPTSMKEVP
ncbi:hypothetical protein GZ998_05430 [Actinomyces sp. 594]|uniref:hypothetical protein n=1 Tax=Actinomyces sp. 594 TaxID=2057793 RepID=UPI001C570BB3|nr:hypothetical protein [Actinomyces sp. 594]MBW3068954.1 hypothetical protein [Actinomyces sp. 594]